jgi:hypothetical protein
MLQTTSCGSRRQAGDCPPYRLKAAALVISCSLLDSLRTDSRILGENKNVEGGRGEIGEEERKEAGKDVRFVKLP